MSEKHMAREINALPESMRKYVHDLETRCDPAGDIQTIADLREQRDALALRLEEAERVMQRCQAIAAEESNSFIIEYKMEQEIKAWTGK